MAVFALGVVESVEGPSSINIGGSERQKLSLRSRCYQYGRLLTLRPGGLVAAGVGRRGR